MASTTRFGGQPAETFFQEATIPVERRECVSRSSRSPRSTLVPARLTRTFAATVADSNVELARRGYEALLQGDLDVIRDLLAPDVTWHGGDPTAEGACHNRTQALEFMRRAVEQHIVGELVDVVGFGDKVVVILRPASEPGTQAPAVANVSTFRNGQVVEMVHYPDPDAAIAAAGPA